VFFFDNLFPAHPVLRMWLIGQIPIIPGTKKEKKTVKYRLQKLRLFHTAMREILKPLSTHAEVCVKLGP